MNGQTCTPAAVDGCVGSLLSAARSDSWPLCRLRGAARRSRCGRRDLLDQHCSAAQAPDLAADLRHQLRRATSPTNRQTWCAWAATGGRRTTGRTTRRTPAATGASRTTVRCRRPTRPVRRSEPTIEQARDVGAAAVVTVPIVDYVAADKNGGCDVRNSGSNYLQTRFKQNKPTKGSALVADTQRDRRLRVRGRVRQLAQGELQRRQPDLLLDNEPDLWSYTHAEVHPSPVTYAELVKRNIDYATAIKSVWPTAKVAGPVNYGFYGFETLAGGAGRGQWQLPRLVPRAP